MRAFGHALVGAEMPVQMRGLAAFPCFRGREAVGAGRALGGLGGVEGGEEVGAEGAKGGLGEGDARLGACVETWWGEGGGEVREEGIGG